MSEPLPGPYQLVADVPGRRLSIFSDDGSRIAVGSPADRMSDDPVALGASLRLLAASWELREALTAIECGRHGIVRGEVQPICARCDASQADGHLPGCIVDTALRKADGRADGGP